jgi:hypothetical protein
MTRAVHPNRPYPPRIEQVNRKTRGRPGIPLGGMILVRRDSFVDIPDADTHFLARKAGPTVWFARSGFALWPRTPMGYRQRGRFPFDPGSEMPGEGSPECRACEAGVAHGKETKWTTRCLRYGVRIMIRLKKG